MFQNFTNMQAWALLLGTFCLGYLLRLYVAAKHKKWLQQQLTTATTELKNQQEKIDLLEEDTQELKDHIEHIMKEKEALVMQITSLGNARG